MGDHVVLNSQAHAHSDDYNYTKTADNILDLLPAGTEGEVVDRVQMKSGNFGIQIKIAALGKGDHDGVANGDVVWVYEYKEGPKQRLSLVNAETWAKTKHAMLVPDSDVTHVKTKAKCIANDSTSSHPTVKAAVQNIHSSFEGKNTSPKWPKDIDVVNVREEEVLAVLNSKHVENESTNKKISKVIVQTCDVEKVPVSLVLSVIQHESGFQTTALNPSGAYGLMQLMPLKDGQGHPINRKNIQTNIQVGVTFLHDLLVKYRAEEQNRNPELNPSQIEEKALSDSLAAYNWGPSRMDDFLAGKKIKGRVYHHVPTVTEKYVTSVTNGYEEYKTILKAEVLADAK